MRRQQYISTIPAKSFYTSHRVASFAISEEHPDAATVVDSDTAAQVIDIGYEYLAVRLRVVPVHDYLVPITSAVRGLDGDGIISCLEKCQDESSRQRDD